MATRRGQGVLIDVTTVVAAPPPVVFDLELDVDVHAGSLAGTAERATTSTGRRVLGPGDEVTFRAVHFGLPWTMTSRVTAYDRPRRFVDEQVRGPFRALRHEHLFDDLGDGRTRMVDRMDVVAPAGPLGALLTRVALGPYLRLLLRRRGRHIARLAGGPATAAGAGEAG
jgi:ligand-binding SRPBCC domain-containing protein